MSTSPPPYTAIPSLHDAVELPADGILSKPIQSDEHIRATLFGLSAGQELTEHTTTMEALLQFLEGEAELTLSGDTHHVGPGFWVRMAPGLPHSIKALTPVKMLLIVLRDSRTATQG